MSRAVLVVLMILTMVYCASSQGLSVINANHPMWPIQEMITKKFAGAGVDILEVSLEGDPRAVGLFSSDGAPFGLTSGLILSSGIVDSAAIPNNTGNLSTQTSGQSITDTTLAMLLPQNDPNVLRDVVKLVIKFIPKAPVLEFRYVFASEEYPEFVCGEFNDVFGFFVQGPRPGGGLYLDENLALVPESGDVVSVNSVHTGKSTLPDCPPINARFYHANPPNLLPAYNAFLDVFTARLEVVPCTEYTIKLALADVVDDNYDTAIFLEANSFQATTYSVAALTPNQSFAIRESCTPASITVRKKLSQDQDDRFIIRFVGEALVGMDYTIEGPLTFTPGQDLFTFQIIPVQDQIFERPENLAIIIPQSICWNDTIWLRLFDPLPFRYPADTLLCSGQGLPINFNTSPYQFSQRNSIPLLPQQIVVSNLEVPVLDWDRAWPGVLASVCLNIKHPDPGRLDIYLKDPAGKTIRLFNSPVGQGADLSNTCFDYSAVLNLSTGSPPFSARYKPVEDWSALYAEIPSTIAGTWQLLIYNTDSSFISGTLVDWSLSFRHPNRADVVISPGSVCLACDSLLWSPVSSGNYQWSVVDYLGCSLQGEVAVSVTDNERFKIECTSLPGEFLFTWPNRLEGELAFSIDGSNWQIIPPDSNALNFSHSLPPQTTMTFYFRFFSVCGVILDTLICEVKDCRSPVLRMERLVGVSCSDQEDGSITLSSTENVRYWVNGIWSDRQTFSQLPPGNYLALAENTVGCRNSLNFTIPGQLPLKADINIIRNIRCHGQENGEAFLRVVQSQGPVIALWNNGEAGLNPRRLRPGINSVSITDQAGCMAEFETRLDSPVAFVVEPIITQPSCGQLASIDLKVNGGISPYRYTWSHDKSNDTDQADQLGTGLYKITVTDRNNCMLMDSVVIDASAVFQALALKRDISCAGLQDGAITLRLSGGIRPYQIRWDNGRSDTIRANLRPGLYRYTVSDGAGCSYAAAVSILAAPAVITADTILQPTCITESLGEIRLFLDPALGPFDIIWTGPSAFENNSFNGIKELGPGNFEVFIRDQRNCFFSKQYQVNKLDTLTYGVTATDISCAGKSDGQIVFNITNSNGVVFYSLDSLTWTTSPLFRQLSGGDYRIFLRDEAYCTASETVQIAEPAALLVNLGADTVIDYGTTIQLEPALVNVQGDATWEWVSSAPLDNFCISCLQQILTPLQSVDIKLSVSDGNNCRDEDVLKISVTDRIIVDVPTIFTPEGNGVNDQLLVHGKPGISIQHFLIFDQKGNLLFRKEDFGTNELSGWDGTFQGRPVPTGMYIWSLKALSRSGQSFETKGGVQLVR